MSALRGVSVLTSNPAPNLTYGLVTNRNISSPHWYICLWKYKPKPSRRVYIPKPDGTKKGNLRGRLLRCIFAVIKLEVQAEDEGDKSLVNRTL